ncbi:MAG TPA: hypothetical protein VJ924_05440 [Alphaproteobacteria bacterium]|nr:hypothetical protein [Alphaproteobacteria bacterium]
MKLNFWDDTWPLDVSECPCDAHFVEYLKVRGVSDKAIFHFGSGEHHLLGIENAKLARPNQIVSVTASRKEYETYIDLAIAQPKVANTYKVTFLDIYTLDRRILPRFDYVSLFHLCEFYDPKNSSYAPLDDRSLLDLFVDRLAPDGRILFYQGSNGWGQGQGIVEDACRAGRLAVDETFLSLFVCRRR